MPRLTPSLLARSGTVLVLAALAGTLVAAVRALPAARLDDAGLTWIVPALAWMLAVAVAVATLAWIVVALRSGSIPAALTAGASASLAGGAVMLLLGPTLPGMPVLGASAFLLAASVAQRAALPGLDDGGRRMTLVVGALVGAQLLAATAVLVGAGDLLLLVATGLASAAGIVGLGRAIAHDALALAIGAGALGIARPGGLEMPIGLAALTVAAVLGLRRALDAPRDPAGPTESDERLPELAARLADAVLRFDGRLRLADWNATAATLLDLDDASRGTRMEDLLGIPISGLPADDRLDTVERGVGGLDITFHRSGGGVTAIIRDPGRAPESERLSRELRGTIEELIQSRRTIDLQRAEIERTASVDRLTGLPSRHAILERLRAEIAEANRYRHPIAVILLDVDDFTDLNRRLGTAVGDAVLAEIALRMRLRVRTADALGRLAGDCFLAILPHTDEAGATTFADALRHRLRAREVVIGRAEVSVGVSAGVAIMRAGDTPDLDGLLARAEEALAAAKTGGGDRVALDRLSEPERLDDHRETDPDHGDRTDVV